MVIPQPMAGSNPATGPPQRSMNACIWKAVVHDFQCCPFFNDFPFETFNATVFAESCPIGM